MVVTQLDKLQGKHIDLDATVRNRNEMVVLFEKNHLQPYEVFSKPKPHQVKYRGCWFPTNVSTLVEGYNAQQTMYVRTIAVGLGLIPPLFCEDDLTEQIGVPAGTTIDEAILADNRSARLAALEFIEERDRDSGDMIRHVLAKKQTNLQQLDSKIYLEVNFFLSVTGDGADKRAYDKMLALLPNLAGTAPYTIDDAYEKLVELATSKLLKFVSITVNAHLMTVTKWMLSLKKGKAPRFDTALPEWLQAARDAMGRFCVFEDAKKTKLVGAPALTALFDDVQKKVDSSAAIEYADIAVFIRFLWLLDPASKTTIQGLERTCSDGCRASAAAEPSCSMASSSTKRASTKRKTGVSPKALLADLMNDS